MLCAFASQFPPFVAKFLQKDRHLRHRFREETVTDMLMASLIVLTPFGNVFVDFPTDEHTTGADMEWHFVSPVDGSDFQLLIQAKRLYGKGDIWTRHNYRGLYHKVNGTFQIDLLCDEAVARGNAYPIYALYNSQQSCTLASHDQITISGVNTADAYLLRQGVRWAHQPGISQTERRRRRIRAKNLKTLHPFLGSLEDILCGTAGASANVGAAPIGAVLFGIVNRQGTTVGTFMPPSPQEVRKRIVDWRERQPWTTLDIKAAPARPEVPPVQKMSEEISAALRARQTTSDGDRPQLRRERSVERPRVIFVCEPAIVTPEILRNFEQALRSRGQQ